MAFTLAAVLGSSGCLDSLFGEPVFEVTLSIEVPAELQRGLSRESPARLYLGDYRQESRKPVVLLKVLCQPSDASIIVSWNSRRVGCATETEYVAWIEPFDPAGPSGLALTDCASDPSPQSVPYELPQPGKATAHGTQTVFQAPTPCEGHANASLVLVPGAIP